MTDRNGESTTYTYDADGNLITEQTGKFEKTYEYNAENRLAVVKAQGTVLMAALYDGDGNRLFTMDYTGENTGDWDIWIPECGGNADTVDDNAKDAMKELASLVSRKDRDDYTITEYVNDITRENEEVLAELNPRGKITTAYTYGYTRESADTGSDTQYYLYDGQNNVSRIASEWGRVKETYTYDPYGNLTYGIPDTVNYYGYNGESQNLATGLQYLRARYYNPHTGNFLTEDTYPGQLSDPLSLNRYDYVSNNPVNYSDPSGHIKLPDWMKNGIDNMKKGVEDVVDTVKKGVNDAVDTVKEAVKGVGDAIKDGINKLTGKDNDKDKDSNTGKDTGGKSGKSKTDTGGKEEDKDDKKVRTPEEKTVKKKKSSIKDKYTTYKSQTEEIEAEVLAEKTKILCSEGAQEVYIGLAAIAAAWYLAPYISSNIIAQYGIVSTKHIAMVEAGSNAFISMASYEAIKSTLDGMDFQNIIVNACETGCVAAVVAMVTAWMSYLISGIGKAPSTNLEDYVDNNNSSADDAVDDVINAADEFVEGGSDIYTPPKGGGGTTATIDVNGKTVNFGHGGRHLEGTGLDVNKVNQTLADEVSKLNLSKGEFYKGRIVVDGVTIEFTSYGLGDDAINIGTYYPIGN